MATGFIDYIKGEYYNGTAVTKLLLANLAVFTVAILVHFADWGAHTGVATDWQMSIAEWLAIPSDPIQLLKRFWTPITSIFLHLDFGHILFNMIALMMFGNIVGDLIGDRRVFPIYLLGGLVGNLFYFISANIVHSYGDLALGASGAIMALAGAAVALSPDYRVNLFLLGPVPVKYVVVFMLLADLVGIADNNNAGGHFAHVGGLIFGWVFVQQLHRGSDYSDGVNNIIDRIADWFAGRTTLRSSSMGGTSSRKPTTEPVFTVKRGGRSAQQPNRREQQQPNRQERLDAILDKIRLQGMASLTDEEKLFLESLKDS